MRSPHHRKRLPTLLRIGLLGVGLLVSMVVILVGCGSKPGTPEYNNPFDPNVPGSDDPFGLRAIYTAAEHSVTLFWNQLEGYDIVDYDITHAIDPDGVFSFVATVEATAAPQLIFTFADPVPNATTYFVVQARNADGDITLRSDMTAAAAPTPPFLTVGDGSGDAPSRHTTLAILTSVGDQMRIADNPAFTDAVVLPAIPDSTVEVAWNLGPAIANGEDKEVYLIVDTMGVASDTAQVTVTVAFDPTFTAFGDPPTVASALIDLAIDAPGALQMRFAPDEADLPAQPWLPADTVYTDYQLADTINPQTIYGEFDGDFGFGAISEYTAVPDDLSGASFQLDLPADRIVSTSTLIALNDAVAHSMRFAEAPDFTGVPWQTYADTAVVTIGNEPGTHVVYGQFRNHWTDSAVFNDYAILVTQALEVTILAPANGAVVSGDGQFQVRGTSLAPAGGSVDSVKVDTGDGLLHAVGTTDWTYLWDVPLVEVDTEWIVRARAYADTDSATTSVTITVTPPAPAIAAQQTGAADEF